MARKTILTTLVALAAFALAGPAAASSASSWPNTTLDHAASSVAGHPVQVWCESSWADWIHAGDEFGQNWDNILGFTNPSEPTVYIAPAECETLHALVNNQDVGTYYASLAILTLAHESVHQRGVTDEGVTDCTALPLVSGLAADYFGWPRKTTETKIVGYTRTIARRVNGKRVKIKVRAQKAVRVTVPNPWLKWLADDALAWHRSAPPEYQGDC